MAYLLALTSRFPVGVSADATVFLELATNLRQGLGLRIADEGGQLTLITHWPPLYPLGLALAGWAGDIPSLEAARWLSAVCLSLSLWLFDRLLRRLGLGQPQRILSLLLLGASLPFGLYGEAMSEGLFLTLELGLLAALLRALKGQEGRWLLLAGLLGGLMLLTRYAALGLLGGAGLFWLLRAGPLGQRLRRGLQFGLPALLLLGLWVAYARLSDSNPTNRSLLWHPVSPRHLQALAGTLLHWLGPAWRPGGLIAGALLLTAARSWRQLRQAYAEGAAAYQLFAWMSAFYMLFLLVSVSLFDFHTPLDSRILAPLYPLLLLLAQPLLRLLLHAPRRHAPALAGLALLLLSSLAAFSVRSAEQLRHGKHYTAQAWQESELLGWLRRLPPGMRIYSNGRDALRLHLGQSYTTLSIPLKINPVTQQPNPMFETEMARMAGEVRRGEAALAWFAGIRRYYLPDSAALRAAFGDLPARPARDGFLHSKLSDVTF